MPETRPKSPGELLRRMYALAEEAKITLEPGTSYQDLVDQADKVDNILGGLYLRVWSDLNNGKIPDIKFEGEEAVWLRSAMHGDAPFQGRYNQTLEALAKEDILVDFEEGESDVLKVVVEPTVELDNKDTPVVSM